MLKYMCDFETSTEAWLEFDDEARVWASCICTIEEMPKIVAINNNLDDFMKELVFEIPFIKSFKGLPDELKTLSIALFKLLLYVSTVLLI